jgi:hypothetical protein
MIQNPDARMSFVSPEDVTTGGLRLDTTLGRQALVVPDRPDSTRAEEREAATVVRLTPREVGRDVLRTLQREAAAVRLQELALRRDGLLVFTGYEIPARGPRSQRARNEVLDANLSAYAQICEGVVPDQDIEEFKKFMTIRLGEADKDPGRYY